ncbi:MAG: RHS repeat-associated core domain-containing protein, partial [Spirochaetes bacterium]|nr:RHS repeat-associated core domain-containing protein [Spirochaetota bacterium]
EYLEKSKNNKVWNKESNQSYLYDGLSFEVIAELHDGDFKHPKGKAWGHWKNKGKNYQTLSEYIYGNGNIVVRTDFDTKHGEKHAWKNKEYYSQDILGSTIMLTDEHGHFKAKYTYDAFGNNYEGRFNRINEIGYNGKRFDAVVGLYDYGFRDYKPLLGRFTTIDPIRDGNNWYVYCSNDSVNFVDPFGLNIFKDILFFIVFQPLPTPSQAAKYLANESGLDVRIKGKVKIGPVSGSGYYSPITDNIGVRGEVSLVPNKTGNVGDVSISTGLDYNLNNKNLEKSSTKLKFKSPKLKTKYVDLTASYIIDTDNMDKIISIEGSKEASVGDTVSIAVAVEARLNLNTLAEFIDEAKELQKIRKQNEINNKKNL